MWRAILKFLSLYNRFQIHINQSFPNLKEKKLLLAISGGIDSMVLCDLLDRLNFPFALAHCNFNLRGEKSDQDEAFVQEEALKRKKEIYTVSFDTKDFAQQHKVSIQMAARALRYNWFQEIVAKNEFDYLLTAHHADDSLETFFINLSRGTGIDGLIGIPENTNWLIRPLLPFAKNEIETYAKENGLAWREDHSNEDTKYLRNKIRKELIPVLKELNPTFMDSFSSTIENLLGSRNIINDKMDEVRKEVIESSSANHEEGIKFNIKKLLNYSDNTAYLYHIFYPYGFRQWKDIRSLLKAQSGKQLYSKTHRIIKHGNYLLLATRSEKIDQPDAFEICEDQQFLRFAKEVIKLESLQSDGHYKINKDIRTAQFDKDLLRFPLIVRKWQKGDYFCPIGIKGKKKLSDFFKDEKYSLLQKENIWLLCSGENIIWLIGKRIDNRYKVTDKTKFILNASLET